MGAVDDLHLITHPLSSFIELAHHLLILSRGQGPGHVLEFDRSSLACIVLSPLWIKCTLGISVEDHPVNGRVLRLVQGMYEVIAEHIRLQADGKVCPAQTVSAAPIATSDNTEVTWQTT